MASGSRPWRIAVTGASGFVGAQFVRHIAAFERPGLEVVPLLQRSGSAGDIRDAQLVSNAMAEFVPDVVLHLAAMALPALVKNDPATAWGVNVIGTLNIAQAILSRAPHARLIYVGSSEAYGSSFLESSEPLRENAPLVPRSAYAATKAAADMMIGQMALDGLKAVRFRPFNHTGPGQSADYVVSSFARQVALIECGLQPPAVRVGNLEAERDFLDVRDVVAAYALASLPETDLPAGVVLNLSTGAPLRIGEILSKLISMAKRPIAIEIDQDRLRPNDIPRASGLPDQAFVHLGWRPTIPFDRTTQDILEAWRNQYA